MQSVAQYLAKTDIGNHVYHSLAAEFKRIGLQLNDSYYTMTVLGCVTMSIQRAYMSPTHCSLNTFNLACANAAHGKSIYLKEIAKFQTNHHVPTALGPVASAPALRKALDRSGSLLWVQDEWATWLSRVTQGDDTHALQIVYLLLELWNGGSRLSASEAITKDSQTAAVEDPRVSVFGAGVPSTTTAALTSPILKDTGFLSRLVLWTPGEPFETEGRIPLTDTWFRHPYANGKLRWGEGVEKLFNHGLRHFYELKHSSCDQKTPEYQAWSRASEQCIRFASLLACAHKRSEVLEEDVNQAHLIVMHSISSVVKVLQGPDYAPQSYAHAVRKLQEILEVMDSREQYSIHQIAMESSWAAGLQEHQIKRYLKTLASYSLIGYDSKLEIWTPTQFFGQNVLEVMKHGLV